MPHLRVAVIGLGHQSLSDHLPALLPRADISVCGVSDPSLEARSQFRTRFPELASVPDYADPVAMLDAVQPDCAIVAVPHQYYFGIVAALCARNIPFLKEKPLARTIDEANRLLALPNFSRCGFVACQRRFSGLYSMAWQALGEIGRPYLFTGVYKLSIDGPHLGWRGDRFLAGGGCLIDMGYHLVDQLTWWFGLPESLSANVSMLAVPDALYTAEDSATVIFGYVSGMHGNILVSRAAGAKHEQYEVYGSEGHIVGSKKGFVLYDSRGGVVRSVEPDGEDMITAQLNFFIARIQGSQPFTDLHEDHMRNMLFIDRCYRSAGVPSPAVRSLTESI